MLSSILTRFAARAPFPVLVQALLESLLTPVRLATWLGYPPSTTVHHTITAAAFALVCDFLHRTDPDEAEFLIDPEAAAAVAELWEMLCSDAVDATRFRDLHTLALLQMTAEPVTRLLTLLATAPDPFFPGWPRRILGDLGLTPTVVPPIVPTPQRLAQLAAPAQPPSHVPRLVIDPVHAVVQDLIAPPTSLLPVPMPTPLPNRTTDLSDQADRTTSRTTAPPTTAPLPTMGSSVSCLWLIPPGHPDAVYAHAAHYFIAAADGLEREPLTPRHTVGRSTHGVVSEQTVRWEERLLRQVIVRRTQNPQEPTVWVTNLPRELADSMTVVEIYSVSADTAQNLVATVKPLLSGLATTLRDVEAESFGEGLTLFAYNVSRVIQALWMKIHHTTALSELLPLTDSTLQGLYRGLMAATEPTDWAWFHTAEPGPLLALLTQWIQQVKPSALSVWRATLKPVATPTAAAPLQAPPKIFTVQKAVSERMTIEILGYVDLRGSADFISAEHIFFLNQAGIYLKQVHVDMQDSELLVEPGKLHYMKGNLELKSVLSKVEGWGGISQAVGRALAAKETLFLTVIRGSGEIFLEPVFKHMMVLRLQDEAVIVDKGSFICAEGTLRVTAVMQRTLSAALLGGEGLFQTKVAGRGVALFLSPVPYNEVRRFDLVNEKLYVDGNFTLMRSADLVFRTELSSKNFLQSLTSGEFLVHTFEGTGSVWLAPTQDVYRDIEAYHSREKRGRFRIF